MDDRDGRGHREHGLTRPPVPMSEVLRRKANAKIRRADGVGPALAITEGMDAVFGGSWVGGEVVLADRTLGFRANAVNRAVQHGDLDVTIDLGDVRGATIVGGIGTKIIEVDLVDGSRFAFRCFGAKEVLAALLATLPEPNDR